MIGDVLGYEQPQSYIVEDTEYTDEGLKTKSLRNTNP